MGAGQSQNNLGSRNTANKAGQNVINHSDIHLDLTVTKDFKDDLKKISDIFKNLNDDNSPELLKHLETYNSEMRNMGKDGFIIPDKIKESLTKFHKEIISQIDEYATKNEEQKNNEFFALLDKQYGSELENQKNIILKSVDISKNEELKNGVNSIMNNVKALKTKYKFFEYKYVELNVFMILFIQYVYQSINTFVIQMSAFNKMRDENRESMFKEAMNVMSGMLKELDISDNKESLTDMLTALKQKIKTNDEEINKKMKDVMVLTTESLSSYLNALTDTTKDQISQALQKQQGGKKKKTKQRGGFVRDFSKFPQAFYDIENIDLPPKPASSIS